MSEYLIFCIRRVPITLMLYTEDSLSASRSFWIKKLYGVITFNSKKIWFHIWICVAKCTKKYENCVIFTLLAARMAHIPVGQKQQRQVRTAGTIQFWATGARLITIAPGCVTCTEGKINSINVLLYEGELKFNCLRKSVTK